MATDVPARTLVLMMDGFGPLPQASDMPNPGA